MTTSPAPMGEPLTEADRAEAMRTWHVTPEGLASHRTALDQIASLADWLVANTGEPKHSYGAVDAAINAMTEMSAQVGVLEGQLAKAADPVNGPVQLAIHRAVCEDSLAHCVENRGRCVRSAEAASWALGLDGGGSDA